MELTILYADDDYVAIHKPSGLLVHRTALDKAATEFAVQILRDQLGQIVYPCHRLDRPTSGVLLFALSPEAARFAQMEFSSRNVYKEYRAVVRGWTDEHGSIDYPLRSEEAPDKSFEAKTDYARLSQSAVDKPIGKYEHARFSLLELKPLTGRKHQLRRHLAHLRHPIIGDTRHGDGAQNRFIREHFDCNRLLLHACGLEIRLPSNAQTICIRSDYDEGFSSIAKELKLLA
ncbi:MAG: pseudouridine synthase [Opitutaceae bacterium]